ncbi:MAG: cellulase family glycosylhydrolase [Chloroflexota bacterium]|nr:cellulase family glycosylhydrolase [Chloroflexota bacterium]
MRNKPVALFSTILILLLLLSGFISNNHAQASAPAQEHPPVPAVPSPTAGDRTFKETGFTVPAVFIKYWDANGALPIFGFPISDAHQEVNRTDSKLYLVQYFERNRFEYHPEFADTPNEVLLGLLGAELTRTRTFPTVDYFPDTAGKVYLDPTKHSLAEPFLTYWRQHGALGIFGYPISEPFMEKNITDGKQYLVQYFQRNRFELHPENQPPYNVLLGLLGKDYMEILSAATAWGLPAKGAPPVTDAIMKPTSPVVGGRFLRGPTVGNGMIIQGYYQDKERVANLVNDLNFTWMKQQVEWKGTETPKGTYFFDELDKIVGTAKAHGDNVMLSVVKAPDWATGGASGYPKNPDDLMDFMRALATHYKGSVGAYEIWNEQNLSGETGDVNPGRYVEILKAAYIGVKAGDPNAIVISGALAPTGVNDPKGQRSPGADAVMPDPLFLEEMYKYNDGEVRGYFDALGAHPYGFNNPPDTKWPDNPNKATKDYSTHNSFYFRRIEDLRSVMEKYGDGVKQMWLTEYGWCSDYRPDGYGECKETTQDQQGQYIVGAIQRAKQYYPWMGVMFLWNLNFSVFQPWYTGPSHFSILNGDWSARPAYFAIKNRPR